MLPWREHRLNGYQVAGVGQGILETSEGGGLPYAYTTGGRQVLPKVRTVPGFHPPGLRGTLPNFPRVHQPICIQWCPLLGR